VWYNDIATITKGENKNMSDYTYEFGKRDVPLEVYEWDNVWWEQTDKTDAPRVLYIGDSISCNARRVATEVAENKILFDGLGTSKGIDNPYFCQTVSLFADQQGERAAIFLNNGLHGWHLDDETEYKQNYENVVRFLLDKFADTPTVLVLTTSVRNAERDARVVVRNCAVSEIAEKYGLSVIDLYTPTHEHPELIAADGVHLTLEGYKLLAGELVAGAKNAIEADRS